MILREIQFLADIDERQLCTIAEHGLNGVGGGGMRDRNIWHGLSVVMRGLDPPMPLRRAPRLAKRDGRYRPGHDIETIELVATSPAARTFSQPRRSSGRSSCGRSYRGWFRSRARSAHGPDNRSSEWRHSGKCRPCPA